MLLSYVIALSYGLSTIFSIFPAVSVEKAFWFRGELGKNDQSAVSLSDIVPGRYGHLKSVYCGNVQSIPRQFFHL